ncbi:uncharacterized protein LOC128742928 [Sabethes cyaneus]|uniref:uncharacterized protein LOC128742928 n=1 Tax=Sabethes cyaneus TaxID=53552 RepID=UPI00237E3AC5|nr:uncharacterized protein LOC128742928 [Sabethes cyaneus]
MYLDIIAKLRELMIYEWLSAGHAKRSEWNVMPSYFFEQGLKVTADVYLKVLKDVFVPWMKKVAAGRHFHFIFHQDGVPAHNASKTQKWLAENVPEFWEKEIWPPSNPDINSLDDFVRGVFERDTNRTPHTTLRLLKAKIIEVMMCMDRNMAKRTCGSLRKRLSTQQSLKRKVTFLNEIIYNSHMLRKKTNHRTFLA